MSDEKIVIDSMRKLIENTEWKNRIFLVGGAVRDEIMGNNPKDLDFVVNGDINSGLNFSIWLAQKLNIYRKDSNPVVYPAYGTAKLSLNNNNLKLPNIELEFVAPRKEEYTVGSRKPKVINGNLNDEVIRRDLTINSLMRNISTNELLDLTGKGLNDIKQGIIRTPADPKIIFKDDPLRMLRAIRFSVKYGFKVMPEVMENISKYAEWIETISKERVGEELNKILITKTPSKGIELLKDTGLLKYIIPELNATVGMEQNIHHTEDVFQHTMTVLDNTPPDLLTRLMALFHDIGKVKTRTVDPDGSVHFYGHEDTSGEMVKEIMSRLKYPNDMINAVALGVSSHMALKNGMDDASKLNDKTLRRFSVATGGHLQNILDLIHADNISHAEGSTMPNQVGVIRQRIEKLGAPVVKSDVKLPIDGNDIKQALGIKNSPLIGQVKKAVEDAWFENPQMTRDDAMKIIDQFRVQNEINEIKRIMKSVIN
jgi:putative nucleotidyltransferase with HDIG domain